jgi:hypothetical protein
MAAAMVRIHRDAELRQRLFARGRARAAQLTPAACAAAWRLLHATLTGGEATRRGTGRAADHPRAAAAPPGRLAAETVAGGT